MYTVRLTGPVGDQHFNIRLLDDLPPGPLKIIIDSPGGCLVSGLAIFHTLRERSGEVITEVLRCGSAAVAVALAGQKRLIHGDGWFFIHECWSCTIGRAGDMFESARLMKEQNKLYDRIISGRTGISLQRVRALTRNETRISSSEAVRLGFVHRVLGTPEPCPPNPSLEQTALGALRYQERMTAPEIASLRKAAWPVAMLTPGAAAVLDRPSKPRPKIPRDNAERALGQFLEAERREASIRRGLATRLQRIVNCNGKISWPLRASWDCSVCGETNFHPPGQHLLATPCRECGATSPEGNQS